MMNVAVVTVGRSGSSALAQMLYWAGPWAEPADMTPLREPKRLVGVNDSICGRFGGSWIDAPASRPLRPSVASFLAGAFNEAWPDPDGWWLWKDPRLSVTLPAWEQVGVVDPASTGVVIIWRNPAEVAESLVESGDLDAGADGVAVWDRLVGRAVVNTRRFRRCSVSYDRLLADPERVCRRLCRWTGVTLAADDEPWKVIDGDRRHRQKSSVATLWTRRLDRWGGPDA